MCGLLLSKLIPFTCKIKSPIFILPSQPTGPSSLMNIISKATVLFERICLIMQIPNVFRILNISSICQMLKVTEITFSKSLKHFSNVSISSIILFHLSHVLEHFDNSCQPKARKHLFWQISHLFGNCLNI